MTGLEIFTAIHTWLSLIAIFAGFVVVAGLIKSHGRQLMTFGFFVTAWLTTLTGFFFPFKGFTPPVVLGIISLVPLALATLARYKGKLRGAWRGTYAINTVLVLYLNVFVLIVQLFQKIPVLNALAPTQTEGPFKIAQLAAFVVCLVLGVLAFRNFQPKFPAPVSNKFESPNL